MLADEGAPPTAWHAYDVCACRRCRWSPGRRCPGRRRRGSSDCREAGESQGGDRSRQGKWPAAANGVPVSGFRWPISRSLPPSERSRCARFLEELRGGTGSGCRSAVRSAAGRPPLDRRGQHLRPGACAADDSQAAVGRHGVVAEADSRRCSDRRRHPRVRAAAAPGESRRSDHRLRRREARGAGAAGRGQRAVDSGGLVALRTQARAGRADRRRRRCGRRVAGRRRVRGTPARAPRGNPPQHPGGRVRSRSSATAASRRSLDDVVRLGAVGYLNARPLVFGLERNPRFAVRFDVPSPCAALLHEGEHRRRPDSVHRISARRPVPDRARPRDRVARSRDVGHALYHPADGDVRSIAMDTSSRTSVALCASSARKLFSDRSPAV